MAEKAQMVRDHAIGRYYDRWLRKSAALPTMDLADMDERTGPDDMQAFAQWFKARQAERQSKRGRCVQLSCGYKVS